MHFISHKALSAARNAPHLRILTKIRPEQVETKRFRFTVSGNLIYYPGDVSTPTTDITSAKCLLHSILSTLNAKFMTIDIKGFYLHTPMDQYDFVRVPVKVTPSYTMQQYQLEAQRTRSRRNPQRHVMSPSWQAR
jgi:hypothetical protein